MILAWLTFFDGLLAIALALAGMIGAHYDFMPSLFGFQLLLLGFFISILGFVAGIIAVIITFAMPSRAAGRTRAVAGVILCLIVIIPIARIVSVTRKYPLINDITTDTKNPPEFVPVSNPTAAWASRMKYDQTKYAEVQESSPIYRNLAPLKMDAQPDDVFKKVEIIAGEIPDWRITYSDPETRTIQGVATTGLFHFKDDFVIQVRDAEGGGSLVEMRSKSRDGQGDLGVNYNRIRSFFQLLQGPPRGVPTLGDAMR